MHPNHIIISLALSAFLFGGCNTVEKLVTESNPVTGTFKSSAISSSGHVPLTEYQPSASQPFEENSQLSNEIVYYSSIEEEPLLTESLVNITPKLIKDPVIELFPDTIPAAEVPVALELASESLNLGILSLIFAFIFFFAAIPLGIIAISKAKEAKEIISNSPGKYSNLKEAEWGFGLGIAGLTFGIMMFVFAILLIVALFGLIGIFNMGF